MHASGRYEWDTLGYKAGSNYSVCESEVTCGFDTHYPEYFPPRAGFDAALRGMQAIGLRVAPYINGRIFDQATASWTAHGGLAQRSAAKKAAPTVRESTCQASALSCARLAAVAVAVAVAVVAAVIAKVLRLLAVVLYPN